MEYKSNGQKIDAYRYISQSKNLQSYEPVLKNKDEKSYKPANGISNTTLSKIPQSLPSNNQKDVDAYELAQAQKSLKLLKSKMSVTPKQIMNPNMEWNDEPKNFNNNRSKRSSEQNINIANQANEDFGNQNKNYRKVFKPPIANEKKEESMPYQKKYEEPNYIKVTKTTSTTNSGGISNKEFKSSSPISQPNRINEKNIIEKKSALEEIQKDEYFAEKKQMPKLPSKTPANNTPISGLSKQSLKSNNPNMKPSPEDYEYYNKNTRDYSKYTYQETNNEDYQEVKQNINSKPTFQKNSLQNNKAPVFQNQQPLSKNKNIYNKNKYHEEEENNQNNQEEEQEEEDQEQEQEDNENNDENSNEEVDAKKMGDNDNENEYGEPGEVVQCTLGCGRKFNANSIKKHMKICKKVFQSKRKTFDSSKARTEGVIEERTMGKSKGSKQTTQTSSKTLTNNKKNLWKKKSDAFRSMLKQGKGQPLSQQEEKNLQNTFEEAQGLTPCNFCGRKFNDNAAKKHIPFCENKTRMEKMKQQGPRKK